MGLEMYEQTTEDLLGFIRGATTQLTSGYVADIYWYSRHDDPQTDRNLGHWALNSLLSFTKKMAQDRKKNLMLKKYNSEQTPSSQVW